MLISCLNNLLTTEATRETEGLPIWTSQGGGNAVHSADKKPVLVEAAPALFMQRAENPGPLTLSKLLFALPEIVLRSHDNLG